jgi:hypothetical protein
MPLATGQGQPWWMDREQFIVALVAAWGLVVTALLSRGRRLMPLRQRICLTCGREARACRCR